MADQEATPARWKPLEEIVEKLKPVIEQARQFKWLWFKAPGDVKYINVRIDMRDGNCYVTDNSDNPVDLETLLSQKYSH